MKIDFNKKLHQDNLKSEIYHRFKNKFFNSQLDLICEYKDSGCRFDLIIFETGSGDVVGLVEVRRINAKKEPDYNGSQYRRYSAFGVKLFYISSFDKIDDLLGEIWATFLENKKNNQCTTKNFTT